MSEWVNSMVLWKISILPMILKSKIYFSKQSLSECEGFQYLCTSELSEHYKKLLKIKSTNQKPEIYEVSQIHITNTISRTSFKI